MGRINVTSWFFAGLRPQQTRTSFVNSGATPCGRRAFVLRRLTYALSSKNTTSVLRGLKLHLGSQEGWSYNLFSLCLKYVASSYSSSLVPLHFLESFICFPAQRLTWACSKAARTFTTHGLIFDNAIRNKLTWLVLGGDPKARSHRVEQFTALWGL